MEWLDGTNETDRDVKNEPQVKVVTSKKTRKLRLKVDFCDFDFGTGICTWRVTHSISLTC